MTRFYYCYVPTWDKRVTTALYKLGGEAHLSALYAEIERMSGAFNFDLTPTFRATVRRTGQKSEKITQDNPGSGVWRLIKSI